MQSAGVLDPQATMVDGMLQLQGQNLWPFADQTQAALTFALAAAMPAVPQDHIKILETVQASTALCLRTPLLLDMHVLPQYSSRHGHACTEN